MIITNSQLGRIYRYLGHDALLHSSVAKVLRYGDEKHGADNTHAEEHIEHALVHLARNGEDEETGERHWVHAVSRLILAIETIIQKERG